MEQPDRTPDDAEIAELIGREISRSRRAKGWSQASLAKRVGLKHGSAIQRFEAGERCPGFARLLRLVTVLEMPFESLVAELLGRPATKSHSTDAERALAKSLVASEALTSRDPALRKLVSQHIEHLDTEDLLFALRRLVGEGDQVEQK